MAVNLQSGVDERSESTELQVYSHVNEGPRGRRPLPAHAPDERVRSEGEAGPQFTWL